jgi:hypothetical protein
MNEVKIESGNTNTNTNTTGNGNGNSTLLTGSLPCFLKKRVSEAVIASRKAVPLGLPKPRI